MLCPQGRQACAQGVYTLALLLASACAFLVSCTEGSHNPSETDLSAFGKYVLALDTPQLERHYARILKADSSLWEGDAAIRRRYADVAHVEDSPLWFSRMGVSSQADSLLALMRRELPCNGLDSSAFYLPQIAEDLDVVHHLAFDSVGRSINEVLPHLDYYLSKAYLRYTIGLRYGFMQPQRFLNRMDYKPTGDYARLFDYEVEAPDYEGAIRKLESSERMSFLEQSQPTGYVYRALQEQMKRTADKGGRHQLAVNMERCRWRMKHPGETGRKVLVNIPALQLWAVDGDSVLSMRICCGATTTKTPLLHSAISYMQVNPEWIIPQNIINSEVAHHGGDSAYFARHRYYIIDKSTGDTLNPAYVGESQMRTGNLRVGQKGGAGNSLGRIVFRFPNNFSVYLHDTNNRGAFNGDRRTLSHGCIRVQKPFELACFLLPDADDWKKDCLRISMGMRPETDRGQSYLQEHNGSSQPFRLLTYLDVSPRVPLYIIYYTAYPNPKTGMVETWPDLYGYDKVISREIKSFLL